MFMRQRFGVLPGRKVILLAILTVLLFVVVTGMLFSGRARGFLSGGQSAQSASIAAVPVLKLSTTQAKVGQTVTLHIVNFTPASNVFVTHDVGVAVQTDRGSSTIKAGADGAADVVIHIDKSWQPGLHIIGAEDTATRYAASIPIQVAA